MTRREWMAGAAAATAASVWSKPANKIDRSRIAAISDEIARSPEAAIEFARLYGLKWLELRDVPGQKGKNYFFMDDADAKAAAKQFRDGGVRISFLNTNLLKFGMPGTEPARRNPEAPEAREKRIAREQLRWNSRMDDLRKCIATAHTLDCRNIRVFAFSRVADPQTVFPRVADVLNDFAKVAETEGVRLLLENETSCNVATCQELGEMMKLVSSNIGINWDVLNGKDMGEEPFPHGYELLPKQRIHNAQIKGRSILPGYPDKFVDWKAIFDRMAADGYQDEIGLETHIFGEGQVAASHASMRAILKIVDPAFLATLPASQP